MAAPSTFPGTIDIIPTLSATSFEDDPNNYHDVVHNLELTAIVALQTRVGVTGSGDTSSLTNQVNALIGLCQTAATPAGQFLASPAGAPGLPSMRAIVSSDLGTALATPPTIGGTTPGVITGTTITANTGFVGNLAGNVTGNLTGTASAATLAANSSQLLGATWASPAAIGTGTPAAGTFTNVTDSALTSGQVVYAGAAGILASDAGFTYAVGSHNLTITGAFQATNAVASTLNLTVNAQVGANAGCYLNAATGQSSFVQFRAAGVDNIQLNGTPGNFQVKDQINSTTPLSYTAGVIGAGFWTFANTTAGGVGTGAIIVSGGINVQGRAAFTGANSMLISQAPSPNVVTAFSLLGGAHVGVTAATEDIDVNFNLARTVQWATSTPVLQRAFVVQAPTYACDTVAQTITNAITFDITGPPVAGTNVTLTNTYALRVEQGTSRFNGPVTINPLAIATGKQTLLGVFMPSDTAQTSGTEINGVNFQMNGTRQWTTSTPATQREVLFQAPTYTCDTAAQTIATAATVAITGAPVAGTNVTITNPYALWVQSGNCFFGGNITATRATLTNSSAPLQINQGAAAIGSPAAFNLVAGAHTTLAAGIECTDVMIGLGRTVQFATSVPALQRAVRITTPTYSCDTAAQTITTAATLDIVGAPIAGTNVTITNPWSLRVEAGSVAMGSAAISTSATTGFLYIATCAGAPTGVPTTTSGILPMVYDTTNHKFWMYDGAWKGVVLS